MRGVPTYTQHSVAWPQLEVRSSEPWVADEINVGFEDAGDGGSYGEFAFRFHEFDRGHKGVQLCVFGDGLEAFYAPRSQRTMARVRTLVVDELTPEGLIECLEAEGFKPSKYHLDGLAAKATEKPEKGASMSAGQREGAR